MGSVNMVFPAAASATFRSLIAKEIQNCKGSLRNRSASARKWRGSQSRRPPRRVRGPFANTTWRAVMKKVLAAVMTVAAVVVAQAAMAETVVGEKQDSGLGTMVYGESLDSGLGSMVYGESLDSGLGQLTELDLRPYMGVE